MSRARTISTVAAGPMEATVGKQAISHVPSVMNASDHAMPALRPRLLADLPDDDCSERAHDEARAEGSQRQQQRRQRVVRREEKFADDDGGEAVDREVVRDKRVTDDGSQDDTGGPCFRGVNQVVCCGVHGRGLGEKAAVPICMDCYSFGLGRSPGNDKAIGILVLEAKSPLWVACAAGDPSFSR